MGSGTLHKTVVSKHSAIANISNLSLFMFYTAFQLIWNQESLFSTERLALTCISGDLNTSGQL